MLKMLTLLFLDTLKAYGDQGLLFLKKTEKHHKRVCKTCELYSKASEAACTDHKKLKTD